jgi:hypothetical protein
MIDGRRMLARSGSAVNASNQPAPDSALDSVAAAHFVCESVAMTILRALSCLTLALSLPACHLVDQRDFDANAGRKPVPKLAAAPPAHVVPALVTILYTTPDPVYRDALTDAVRRALARKPDVLFSVNAMIPPAGGPDAVAEAEAEAAASGREVAQTIVDAGAQPGQVEQVVGVDASASLREVIVRVQ